MSTLRIVRQQSKSANFQADDESTAIDERVMDVTTRWVLSSPVRLMSSVKPIVEVIPNIAGGSDRPLLVEPAAAVETVCARMKDHSANAFTKVTVSALEPHPDQRDMDEPRGL